MSRVFTITDGLENMGAMRTGGQGSVYKGKRIGEIITAVKLLPTPIHAESDDDKNFRSFQNEVAKLKRVNEEPNPNVVKILSSGITDSGSLPFIEMEYIDGPDLEELLKHPHDPVFSIKETIKLADQLACALAHCHKFDVKHGDIKSNNVKFNVNSGNYMLLDFGLSIMSDEQRRTSLRHAGAIEFMAPEQNDGQMLFQTDVYSYGIILFELLAGTVPYPLPDNGETARNNVMISHMESPLPNILELRMKNLPGSWPEEKKQREMLVPKWLLDIIYKCLEKQPEKRFSNGLELHEAIIDNSIAAVNNHEPGAQGSTVIIQSEVDRLQAMLTAKDEHLTQLKEKLAGREAELLALKNQSAFAKSAVPVARPVFLILLFLMLSLVGYAAYTLLAGKSSDKDMDSIRDSIASTDSVKRTGPVAGMTNPIVRADSIKKAQASHPKTISAPQSPAVQSVPTAAPGNGKAKGHGKGKKNKFFDVKIVP